MPKELESALRDWWHTRMRHGETASEMSKSLVGSLYEAGFVIVPKDLAPDRGDSYLQTR